MYPYVVAKHHEAKRWLTCNACPCSFVYTACVLSGCSDAIRYELLLLNEQVLPSNWLMSCSACCVGWILLTILAMLLPQELLSVRITALNFSPSVGSCFADLLIC